jgi:hypothetical protein
LFNAKADGAAGATAVKVSNLAVEVLIGFESAAFEVIDSPTPFTDFTPILKTLVKVVSTVALVAVFSRVTPAKCT